MAGGDSGQDTIEGGGPGQHDHGAEERGGNDEGKCDNRKDFNFGRNYSIGEGDYLEGFTKAGRPAAFEHPLLDTTVGARDRSNSQQQ